uniref:ENTH domain-containing protein n=1 Tax=Kalanchoe fedtschenkoi TaxID=63787 RepID=A0A7N0T6M1_KALFE
MAAGSGSGPQQNLRKAIGAIKDSTKVGLVIVNSEFKDLDVAIVKATNHIEKLPKEKHVRTIFSAMSASRPQQDVNYCIDALTKRLAKTHNWAVALKTLLVIHRALKEIGSSFCQELTAHSRGRSGLMMHLSHFKDDSTPNAWDYSAWVRTYALFLEERIECFRVLKYDVQKDQSRTKNLFTPDLLDQLPAMQQLLHRLLACQPEGAAAYNNLIQYALAMVASESVWIYVAIADGILNLVDKYFEMQRQEAIRALDIYKKASDQAEKLSEFFESCRGLAFGKGQKFVKIKQPPASFIISMEEYVKDIKERIAVTPHADALLDDFTFNFDDVGAEEPKQSDTTSKEAAKDEMDAETATAVASREAVEVDLLCFDDLNEEASELEEKNADSAKALSSTSETPNWELALVSASSSIEAAGSGSKLAGGLDKLTLDSLYDKAISQGATYYVKQPAPNPFMDDAHDTCSSFQVPTSVQPPTNVQMGNVATQHQQQDILVIQQQQPPGGHDPYNPFLTSEQTPPSQPTKDPFSGLI